MQLAEISIRRPVFATVLSLLVLASPGKAGSTEDGDDAAVATTAESRRTFAIYAGALVLLAVGFSFGAGVLDQAGIAPLPEAAGAG